MDLLTAVLLAEASYEDDPVIDGWSFEPLHVGETQVFGCEHRGGALAVAFRGSSSRRDWITDFKFGTIKRPLIPGRWHRGISGAFDDVADGIEKWLDRPFTLRRERPCLIGHSLGGGLATIAASRFRDLSLITFGAPRVCTYRAAAWLREGLTSTNPLTRQAVRLARYGDPVPGVPFRIGFQRGVYTHAIPVTMLGEKGMDRERDHPIERYIEDLRTEGS